MINDTAASWLPLRLPSPPEALDDERLNRKGAPSPRPVTTSVSRRPASSAVKCLALNPQLEYVVQHGMTLDPLDRTTYREKSSPADNWSIELDYHFGGFARRKPVLDGFIADLPTAFDRGRDG